MKLFKQILWTFGWGYIGTILSNKYSITSWELLSVLLIVFIFTLIVNF